jgi:2-amino-4-hydroxy-6-hydroxymethyldihydropteridine diphosphokinase
MSAKIDHAYVCLGSNLGDRAGNLLLGVRGLIDSVLDVRRLSKVYETQPVGEIEQPAFLNMVAELRGERLPPPESLMARLLRIEYSLGRTRNVPKGPRSIDLDLLFYRKEKRDTQYLTLPHPRLHQRRFVLVPMAELCPRLVHPVLHVTIEELLKTTTDHSKVELWKPGGEW